MTESNSTPLPVREVLLIPEPQHRSNRQTGDAVHRLLQGLCVAGRSSANIGKHVRGSGIFNVSLPCATSYGDKRADDRQPVDNDRLCDRPIWQKPPGELESGLARQPDSTNSLANCISVSTKRNRNTEGYP
jgi:hypothetical protein